MKEPSAIEGGSSPKICVVSRSARRISFAIKKLEQIGRDLVGCCWLEVGCWEACDLASASVLIWAGRALGWRDSGVRSSILCVRPCARVAVTIEA